LLGEIVHALPLFGVCPGKWNPALDTRFNK
jgi:hypothetical protein